jgi:hypothetical protein
VLTQLLLSHTTTSAERRGERLSAREAIHASPLASIFYISPACAAGSLLGALLFERAALMSAVISLMSAVIRLMGAVIRLMSAVISSSLSARPSTPRPSAPYRPLDALCCYPSVRSRVGSSHSSCVNTPSSRSPRHSHSRCSARRSRNS